MKDNSAAVEGRKDLAVFFENKSTEKPAEAEN